jgi:YgiT-type zinc finger domain-containing protein
MQITICPICGSNQIKSLSGKMTFKTPQGEITIPKVPRQCCSNCSEQFFDHESNKVLDRYRGKRSKIYTYVEPTTSLVVGEDSEGKKYRRHRSTR